MPAVPGRTESAHLATFPTASDILGGNVPVEDVKQKEEWATLHAVREQVLKALEEARNSKLIGGGLAAQVTVSAADPIHAVLAKYESQLRYIFIVSAVALKKAAPGNGAGSGVAVEVTRADGQKCERCWNYSTHVGEDSVYPTICERCSAVLKEIEGN